MLRELRIASLKKSIWLVLLLACLGLYFFSDCMDGIRALTGGLQDLDRMQAGEIEPGTYVEATVYGIYDQYAYTEEKNSSQTKVISNEYVIPVGKAQYMGLYVPGEYQDSCESLMESSWDYMYGNSDGISGQFSVRGTVLKMDSESRSFYREYLQEYADYDNLSAEEKAAFLPYYLKVDHIGGHTRAGFYGTALAAAVFWSAALILLCRVLSGSCQKSILKYGRQPGGMERLENFYRSTEPVEGLRFDRDFVLGMQGAKHFLIPTEELLWTYLHETAHKHYFVTVGKSYGVMLGTKDGRLWQQTVKSKEKGQALLKAINRILPYVVVGYTEDSAQMFFRNRSEMILKVKEGRGKLGPGLSPTLSTK